MNEEKFKQEFGQEVFALTNEAWEILDDIEGDIRYENWLNAIGHILRSFPHERVVKETLAEKQLIGAKKIIDYAIKNSYWYGMGEMRLLKYIERIGKQYDL